MSDYEKDLAQFVADEKQRSERKPSGFFAEWAFYVVAKKKFDRMRQPETNKRIESEQE